MNDVILPLVSALFAAGWALAAYFARRDRASIHQEILNLRAAISEMGHSVNALRDEIKNMAVEHERRLAILETLIFHSKERMQ